MDFSLTEEQEFLRKTARDFAKSEVLPIAAAIDSEHRHPSELIKKMSAMGLMGVARDNYPRDGATFSFTAGFAEVEVDVETGAVTLVDYLGVADVGTVINPRSLIAQINGGSCLGIAHALFQKAVVDPRYGETLAIIFFAASAFTIFGGATPSTSKHVITDDSAGSVGV